MNDKKDLLARLNRIRSDLLDALVEIENIQHEMLSYRDQFYLQSMPAPEPLAIENARQYRTSSRSINQEKLDTIFNALPKDMSHAINIDEIVERTSISPAVVRTGMYRLLDENRVQRGIDPIGGRSHVFWRREST